MRLQITKLQEQVSTNENKIVTHDHKFIDIGERLKSHQADLTVLARNVGNLEASKLDVKKGEIKHKSLVEEISKMKEEIALSENHLVTIESFVDKYLPIRVQSQISELLGEIMEKGGEMHTKLLTFEKAKFDDLYEEILADDGIPNLMGRIDEIMV